MLCEKCKENQANVQIVQNINGKVKKIHICEKCAGKIGLKKFEGPKLSFADVLSALSELNAVSPKHALKCSFCSMDYGDFKKKVRLGCAHCYSEFKEALEPLLKRLHSNIVHRGKIPVNMKETAAAQNKIMELEKELKDLIKKEEYEEAAVVRDRIKEIKGAVK